MAALHKTHKNVERQFPKGGTDLLIFSKILARVIIVEACIDLLNKLKIDTQMKAAAICDDESSRTAQLCVVRRTVYNRTVTRTGEIPLFLLQKIKTDFYSSIISFCTSTVNQNFVQKTHERFTDFRLRFIRSGGRRKNGSFLFLG
jgi:hypothetical protein